ncbi:hypothetical protein CRUP_030044 [Coryphaenoides rupestris]|nr:hypothetical protein CRUP_030044 [Coryphaenoides rupestris]
MDYPIKMITFKNEVGQYDLEVTTFQLAVLFAWNQRPRERISFENLKLATELPDAELRRTLWDFSLIKNSKVQKRGKINLIGRLQLTTERMREEENEGIVQLRILRTQEAIIQIMKMRKRLSNAQLQTELVEILKNMFLPQKKMIKEQIEWLIEHKNMFFRISTSSVCSWALLMRFLIFMIWMMASWSERAPQLGVGQLGGQLEVLEADSLAGPLVPGKQHGQLEGGHLQVILPHLVLKGDLEQRRRGLVEEMEGGGGGQDRG